MMLRKSMTIFVAKVEAPLSLNLIFQALVYDFQPKDPENVYVALAVLSGKAVEGEPFSFNHILGCAIYNCVLYIVLKLMLGNAITNWLKFRFLQHA